jgi:branched-chain amino acid transport system substrate-binding protein
MLIRLSLAFLAIVAMLAPPAARSAEQPYELNAILSLTGVAAFLGSSEKQALDVLENVVNASGGIGGRPLKFVYADDQSNPQQAVILANAAIAKKVAAVIGPGFTATCKAVEPLFINGPVDYCLSPAGGGPPGGYVFSASFSTPDGYKALVRYFRSRGWKRIGLLVSTDATGQDGERGIVAAMALPENKDATLVALEHFNPTDLSVAAQLSRVEAGKPDAVIFWTLGTPLGTVLRAVNEASFDKPIATSHGNMTLAAMDTLGSAGLIPKGGLLFAAPRLFQRDTLRPGPLLASIDAFDGAFKAVGLRVDGAYTYAWDPGEIIIAALRKLGPNATAAQVRDFIQALHGYMGINGMYDFRDGSQRGLTGASVVVAKWDPSRRTWVAISGPGGVPVAGR